MAKIGKVPPILGLLVLATVLNPSGPRIEAAETVKALRIEPQGVALPNSGASQRFIVTAVSSAGTEIDVTHLCRVSVSNPEVLSVDTTKGLLIGKSPGRAALRISQGK